MISVVINTLNEEHNLPYCLRSVAAWATDIVVVDMHSTDATREIAERFGARVFLHEPLGFADPARAFAVSQASGDWVLVLDADELVPAALYRELSRIATTDHTDVVKIPRRNYMFGASLAHTGWDPARDAQLRFFRKGALTLTHEIHRFLQPNPGARVMTLPDRDEWHLIHFNYVSIQQFVEKLNRYTTIEAIQSLERGTEFTPGKALRWAAKEWYQRFIAQRGYKDGWRGFYLALMMAFYRVITAAKLAELRQMGTAPEIAKRYAQIAEELIAQYDDTAPPAAPGASSPAPNRGA